MDVYFGKDKEKVIFRSSPYPVDRNVEYELHGILPLNDKDKEETEKKYGKNNTWKRALQHISVYSRIYMNHATMRLSG